MTGTGWLRRWLVAVVLATGWLATVPTAGHSQETDLQRVIVLDGRGWGHGVGMAQEGARTMGAAGATTAAILDQFYPGTTLASGGGTLAVAVSAEGGTAVVAFPDGGRVTDNVDGRPGDGFPIAVPAGGRVSMTLEGGRYRARLLGDAPAVAGITRAAVAPPAVAQVATTTTIISAPTTAATGTSTTVAPTTTVPPTTTTTPPTTAPPTTRAPAPPAAISDRPLWAVPPGGGSTTVESRQRTYRGSLEARTSPDGGALQLVDHVDVEDYLRGMGEVLDPRWPAAALQAQAIAARTYALRSVAGGGTLCDDDHCQVYLGRTAEYPAMDAAVASTAGQVLRYGSGLADTVYSANGGGVSATTEEGFGGDGAAYPYLRAATYPTDDPHVWSVRLSPAEIAAKLGYGGTIDAVRIARAGPSTRVLDIVVEGSAGSVPLDGRTFAARLGLLSTLFSVREELVVAPPLPPADAPDGAATGGAPAPLPAPSTLAGAAGGRTWWPIALAFSVAALLVATRWHWGRSRPGSARPATAMATAPAPAGGGPDVLPTPATAMASATAPAYVGPDVLPTPAPPPAPAEPEPVPLPPPVETAADPGPADAPPVERPPAPPPEVVVEPERVAVVAVEPEPAPTVAVAVEAREHRASHRKAAAAGAAAVAGLAWAAGRARRRRSGG